MLRETAAVGRTTGLSVVNKRALLKYEWLFIVLGLNRLRKRGLKASAAIGLPWISLRSG